MEIKYISIHESKNVVVNLMTDNKIDGVSLMTILREEHDLSAAGSGRLDDFNYTVSGNLKTPNGAELRRTLTLQQLIAITQGISITVDIPEQEVREARTTLAVNFSEVSGREITPISVTSTFFPWWTNQFPSGLQSQIDQSFRTWNTRMTTWLNQPYNQNGVRHINTVPETAPFVTPEVSFMSFSHNLRHVINTSSIGNQTTIRVAPSEEFSALDIAAIWEGFMFIFPGPIITMPGGSSQTVTFSTSTTFSYNQARITSIVFSVEIGSVTWRVSEQINYGGDKVLRLGENTLLTAESRFENIPLANHIAEHISYSYPQKEVVSFDYTGNHLLQLGDLFILEDLIGISNNIIFNIVELEIVGVVDPIQRVYGVKSKHLLENFPIVTHLHVQLANQLLVTVEFPQPITSKITVITRHTATPTQFVTSTFEFLPGMTTMTIDHRSTLLPTITSYEIRSITPASDDVFIYSRPNQLTKRIL